MMDQLSLKEYEDPFKDAKSMEDNDSSEIPAAPLGAAGIWPL